LAPENRNCATAAAMTANHWPIALAFESLSSVFSKTVEKRPQKRLRREEIFRNNVTAEAIFVL